MAGTPLHAQIAQCRLSLYEGLNPCILGWIWAHLR